MNKFLIGMRMDDITTVDWIQEMVWCEFHPDQAITEYSVLQVTVEQVRTFLGKLVVDLCSDLAKEHDDEDFIKVQTDSIVQVKAALRKLRDLPPLKFILLT